MKIRCLKCKAINPYEMGPDRYRAITCGECGARFFPVHRDDGRNVHRDVEKAGAELAQVSRIDLASANSVVLGLMTLHQAQALQDDFPSGTDSGRKREASPKEPQPAAPPGIRDRRRDLMRQARWMAERHDLSLAAALRVVRREQTLEAAKSEEESAKQSGRPTKKPISTPTAVLVSAIVIFAAIGIGTQGWRSWRATEAANPATTRIEHEAKLVPQTEIDSETRRVEPSRAQVQRDSDGKLTWISAPTAEEVLVAYCRQRGALAEHCEPLEIASTRPDRTDARLGLLRLSSDITEEYAITILEDRESGWWSAGTGESVLDPYVIVPHRIGDRRRPISEPRHEKEDPTTERRS